MHGDKQRPSVRRSVAHASESGAIGENALMTRRRFLYGAIGVGAVAAVGIGAAALGGSMSSGDPTISTLDVPKDALSTLNDFEALETYENSVRKIGEFDLPYGTLIWASDESTAACLLPTESGSPLAQVALLHLGSGSSDTVLEKAVGAADGFEIYDVRANSAGIIWTEANILQGSWRVYATTVSGSAIGEPVLVEEGDDAYETPTIAVTRTRAIWQLNPKKVDSSASETREPPSARLMSANHAGSDIATLFETKLRMATPPYAHGDTVTFAPRLDSSSTYYQLTNIDAVTGEVRDTMTLPHAITPIEAGYGDTGFMFSFPDIYNYDSAISNLGTYAPREKANGDYNNVKWFDFTRTPTAAPAWCNGLLIVKSTYAVCGIDLEAGAYFAIDVDDGAESYGDYLASTGTGDSFVTYTNIDHTPIGEAKIHTCRVKVWTTLA